MKILILSFLLINTLTTSVKANSGDTLYVNPNPCDSLTTIYYTISQTDSVTLEVYNFAGQVTELFFSKSLLTAGSYSIIYNTDSLPNGYYLVRLQIGSSQKRTRFLKSKGVGLNENASYMTTFNVYPNPTVSILNIEYQGLKSYQIIDQNGKVIQQNQIVLNEIDLADLISGTYFLKVYSGNNKLLATKKIIKN